MRRHCRSSRSNRSAMLRQVRPRARAATTASLRAMRSRVVTCPLSPTAPGVGHVTSGRSDDARCMSLPIPGRGPAPLQARPRRHASNGRAGPEVDRDRRWTGGSPPPPVPPGSSCDAGRARYANGADVRRPRRSGRSHDTLVLLLLKRTVSGGRPKDGPGGCSRGAAGFVTTGWLGPRAPGHSSVTSRAGPARLLRRIAYSRTACPSSTLLRLGRCSAPTSTGRDDLGC